MSDTYRKRKYRALKRISNENDFSAETNCELNVGKRQRTNNDSEEDLLSCNNKNPVQEFANKCSTSNENVQVPPEIIEYSRHSLLQPSVCKEDTGLSSQQSSNVDYSIYLSDSSSEACESSDSLSESDDNDLQCSLEETGFSNILQSLDNDKEKKILLKGDLRTKLHVWAIKYRKNLTRSCIENLLHDLRSEGLPDIPKSCATLIPSDATKDFDIKVMQSSRGKLGSFVYFGISEALQKIIVPTIYTEKTIDIVVNIDGMQVFSKSREQLWPILGMIVHDDYNSLPFIIALFGGNSKPDSAEEFFQQFVKEMNDLLTNGIVIGETLYRIRFLGFVCDTPARAFIKGSKSHVGFCSCERCEVHGITIKKKRVFTEVDSKLRTDFSFRNKSQKDHHVKECYLLQLIGFDPVKHVFLDSMHLLFEGIMKFLLDRWLCGNKQKGKLSQEKRTILTSCLVSASSGIPFEFQRKTLDVENLVNWKATQYRFVLLYCSGIILKHVLESDSYQHFMLLFVATHILCSKELAVKYANYAKILLEQFFILFPTFFGEDSQTINNHNLIHVADDVLNTNKSLSDLSAFPFENCLGQLKSLIKGRKDIVPQIIKRISEIDYCPQVVDFKLAVNNVVKKKENLIIEEEHKSSGEIKSMILRDMKITTNEPDNIVILKSGNFFKVSQIKKTNDTYMVIGNIINCEGESFNYPCKSSKVGIWKLGSQNTDDEMIAVDDIKYKCIVLKIKEETHAFNYLHIC